MCSSLFFFYISCHLFDLFSEKLQFLQRARQIRLMQAVPSFDSTRARAVSPFHSAAAKRRVHKNGQLNTQDHGVTERERERECEIGMDLVSTTKTCPSFVTSEPRWIRIAHGNWGISIPILSVLCCVQGHIPRHPQSPVSSYTSNRHPFLHPQPCSPGLSRRCAAQSRPCPALSCPSSNS